jgi:hypothetical protein
MGIVRRRSVIVLISLGLALGAAHAALAQRAEIVGVITEIKPGRGRAEVKPAGATAWHSGEPLQALRVGDEVRVSEDAAVVVLLSNVRGVVRVDAARSPYLIAQPPRPGKAEKARILVENSITFLSACAKEAPRAILLTRETFRRFAILAPRESVVLPGPLVFEWVSDPRTSYTLRVVGPSGVVLERNDISGGRFEYPADAPALAPRVRYALEITGSSSVSDVTHFEVLDAAAAATERDGLDQLAASLGAGASPPSLAVAQAGMLADHGLIYDARRTVLAALVRDPAEPTLHTLLANLYLLSGLLQPARASFNEARRLLSDAHGR